MCKTEEMMKLMATLIIIGFVKDRRQKSVKGVLKDDQR